MGWIFLCLALWGIGSELSDINDELAKINREIRLARSEVSEVWKKKEQD